MCRVKTMLTSLAMIAVAAPMVAKAQSPDEASDRFSETMAEARTRAAPHKGYSPPRTPSGRPDFQEVVWATNFLPVLEASPTMTTLVVSEEVAASIKEFAVASFFASADPNAFLDPEGPELVGDSDGLPIVRGERRTRAVVIPADGVLPYHPEARAELDATDPQEHPYANPEERPGGERCLGEAGIAPAASTLGLNHLQFVQTETHVVIHIEYGDVPRIIPFAATHRPEALRPRIGDSIARWDGDTLVIETIGLPASARVRNFPKFIVSSKARVVERITRIAGNELLYQYSVIDPDIYAAPWLAEHSLFASGTRMYPSSCHEENYSLPNILQGARMRELRARIDG